MCQAIHRRQSPTTAPPDSLENVGNTSLMTYLERYGGFGAHRELGLVIWSVARIFEAAQDNNMGAVRDHTALLAVMLEQTNMDGNQWGVAWMLGRKSSSFSINKPRSFCNGRSQSLRSTLLPTMGHHSLAVLTEQEVLATKRSEAAQPKPKSSSEQTQTRGQNQGQSQSGGGTIQIHLPAQTQPSARQSGANSKSLDS